MSYYYTYYVGYKDKDDKLYPVGPFGCDGKIYPVINRSRSFASDLHEDFRGVDESQLTPEFMKIFVDESDGEINPEDLKMEDWMQAGWLRVSELPTGSYLKHGYYLIDDVMAYEKEPDVWPQENDLFYDWLSPMAYTAKLKSDIQKETAALKAGVSSESVHVKKDDEGFEYREHPASEYMYYVWPDYASKEYEADELRKAASMFDFIKLPEGAELVIIETEG